MSEQSRLKRLLLLLAAKVSESEGGVEGDIEEGCLRVEGEVERDISETRSWGACRVDVRLGAWGRPGMESVPPGALIAISYRPTISIDRTTT